MRLQNLRREVGGEQTAPAAGAFPQAVGTGLAVAGITTLVGQGFVWLLDHRGVAVNHFGWVAEKARTGVAAHLDLLSPEEDEAVLREAGFSDVTPFYAAFTWRGWVAYA